jgi:hypothetical protein
LSAANAVKMAKPIYSQLAQRSQIEGRVVVEVSLDEEGNVTAAKAIAAINSSEVRRRTQHVGLSSSLPCSTASRSKGRA